VTADAPEDEPDEVEPLEPLEPEPLESLEPLAPEPLDPLEPEAVEPLVPEPVDEPEAVDDEPVEPVEPLDELPVEDPLALVRDGAGCVAAPAVLVELPVAPRAGSCPVTRRPNIRTQAARKSDSVIVTTRRRMVRARRLRARTRSRARIRPSSGDIGGGLEDGVCMVGSIAPRRESAVGTS
jgi:hypothetical protein